MRKAKKTTGQKVWAGIGWTIAVLCMLFVVYVITCAIVGAIDNGMSFADAFKTMFGLIPAAEPAVTEEATEAAAEAAALSVPA